MNDIQNEIKATEKIEDFDNCYFTYYEFDKDYFAKPIGSDKMGSLEHTHVTNFELEREHSRLIMKKEQ